MYIFMGIAMVPMGVVMGVWVLDSKDTFFTIVVGIVSLLFIVGGIYSIYADIRNAFTSITFTTTSDSLAIKFSNLDQPLTIEKGAPITLVVDGIELIKGNPTHRIIMELQYEGETFACLGAVTKSQYLWLKELLKIYCDLTIVYKNYILENMQL